MVPSTPGWGVVGCALCVVFGCSRPAPPAAPALDAARATADVGAPPAPAPTGASEEGHGHARMVALLASVARESNSYFDASGVLEMKTELAALTVPLARLRVLVQLGWNKLRLGRHREAIADLEAARALVLELPPAKRHAELHIDYLLAVTWLRVAADENCVAPRRADLCVLPGGGDGTPPGGGHTRPAAATAAIEALGRVIRHPRVDHPRLVAAGWLTNLAYQQIGGYPHDVPRDYLIDPKAFESAPFRRFTEIGAALGLDRVSLSGGAVVDDLDGDGDLDIATSSWAPKTRLGLWRNNGDGTFTERGEDAGLRGITGGLNLIHADYDGDGDVDLLVLRGAWLGEAGRHPNSLLRNDGHGNFEDVTFAAGLGDSRYPTQTADFADYDHDGDLDLYVGNEALSADGWPNELFRNNGDGTFTDVAAGAGVLDRRFTKGVAWGDFDGDGWADLYLSNAGAANRLYRNRGDGTFEDVAARAGVEAPWVGFPTWWWDFDNDGRLDLMAFNGYFPKGQAPPVWNVAAGYIGIPHQGEPSRLYRNVGDGRFEEVAADRGFRLHTLTMGSNFGDLDNDGWLDVYLGTGYPEYEGLMPNVALRNVAGRFVDVSFSSGLAHLQKGHGVAFADLDRDGDQDLFEQMGGAFPGDAFGNVLYENPGFGNHWLVVEAVGVRSNRSAIGARLRVVIREASGARRSIYRHVDTGGSFGGNPLRQHIGLGTAVRVERLELHWPRTGRTQAFEDLEVDQALRIREDAAVVEGLSYRATPFERRAQRPDD